MTKRSFEDDKWVRIMADFCADGVWLKDGAGTTADDLPISTRLRDELRSWQRAYDKDGDEPGFDAAVFSKWGYKIALDVKRELPDWIVIYFDEARANMKPALDYEYEIRLPIDSF